MSSKSHDLVCCTSVKQMQEKKLPVRILTHVGSFLPGYHIVGLKIIWLSHWIMDKNFVQKEDCFGIVTLTYKGKSRLHLKWYWKKKCKSSSLASIAVEPCYERKKMWFVLSKFWDQFRHKLWSYVRHAQLILVFADCLLIWRWWYALAQWMLSFFS